MRARVHLFVIGLTITALLAAGALYRGGPQGVSLHFGDALLLCVLAIAGELLPFALPQSATGTIGFIPYFAAAILVPSWASVASVALVSALLELWYRREAIKGVFNVAAQ